MHNRQPERRQRKLSVQNCARQRPTLSSKATWHQSPSRPSVARRMLEPMASEPTAVPRPVKMTHRLHRWGLGQGQSHHGQMPSQWQRTLGQRWTFLWCHLWECRQSMPTPPSPKWLPVSHCAPFTGSLVGEGGGDFHLIHSQIWIVWFQFLFATGKQKQVGG